MVELKFDFTVDDMMAFQRYYLKTDARIKRSIRSFIITMSVLMAILALVRCEDLSSRSLIIAGCTLAISALLLILLAPRLLRWSYVSQAKSRVSSPEYAKHYGPGRIAIDENGVEFENCEETAMLKWSAFTQLVEVEDYFFLCKSPAVAIVIPKRSATAGEIENLRSLFKTHIPAVQVKY